MSGQDTISAIRNYLLQHYSSEEFPALEEQAKDWSATRPLEGLKILDATPVFRNTLAKYRALLCGGAELHVSLAPRVIYDRRIVDLLSGWGIKTVRTPEQEQPYDIVMDCAGIHASLTPRLGFVELTRSGYSKYASSPYPVYLADAGRIKLIETTLGTGDGFIRAMKQLGHGELQGKTILVFGYGKVGKGIALYARREGAEVIVVDTVQVQTQFPPGMRFLDWEEGEKVQAAIQTAYCLVSATGMKDALAELPADLINTTSALIANMGVEDEWGEHIPEERVLNRKIPLNFILEEPTRMRFIEATMALDNAGAIPLVKGLLPPGICLPDPILEENILRITRDHGLISADLNMASL